MSEDNNYRVKFKYRLISTINIYREIDIGGVRALDGSRGEARKLLGCGRWRG
jgi:hypothetical protein